MQLIKNIIDELSSSDGKLTEALIKAKMLAHQLQNQELKKWLDNELNGYERNEDLPLYRVLTCEVRGTVSNGYKTIEDYLLPLSFLGEDMRKLATSFNLKQSIATLEPFAKSTENGSMAHNVNPEACYFLSEGLSAGYEVLEAK
jgi:hypothetical protein